MNNLQDSKVSFCMNNLQDSKPKASSKQFENSYGYEKIWRPTRAKVDGAGASSLGSNMTSREPEQWRPSIRYVDPGTGAWIYYQPWKPSKKHVIPKAQNVESAEDKSTRKKYIMVGKPPNGSEWPSPRAPGTCLPKSQWEPPFRKGNKDDLKPTRNPRKHVETFKDEYESTGVRTTLDPKSSLPPVIGKRRLPTYRNEQLSFGVGAALKFSDYNPTILL